MSAPQTLPANFQGWDKTAPGAPATLPANFNQWDKAEPEPTQFEKDRAVTEAWAHGHKILGPIARFLVAGGQNAASAITDTPSYLYHAITDPPTGEEVGLTPEQRVIARLGLEQATKAGMSYASGEVTPKGALSVLPEALGTGLGQVAGGAAYGKLGNVAEDIVGAGSDFLTTPKGQAVSAGLKALSKSAVKRIPYVGEVHADVIKAMREAYKQAQAEPAASTPEAPAENAPQTATPASGFEPSKITPQGMYYLGRLQEIAQRIEAEEAAVGPKNVTPSRAAALKNPVTPAASSDDLTALLEESVKRARMRGSLSDLK